VAGLFRHFAPLGWLTLRETRGDYGAPFEAGERQARQRARRERRAIGVWVWPQAAQEGWRRGSFETPLRFAAGSSG